MSYRKTELTIDLTCLKNNFNYVRKLVGDRKICAVVKANAYGHGAFEVSKALSEEGAEWLAVATLDEGIDLRASGITSPEILVLGGNYKSTEVALHEYNLVPSLYSRKSFEDLFNSRIATPRFQIEIDTGMSRLGLSPSDVTYICGQYNDELHDKLVGVFTHFSHADEQNYEENDRQISLFEDVISKFTQVGVDIGIVHAANSAAAITYPRSYYQMVRPGLMLYGINPLGVGYDVPLEPVATWKTKPLLVRKITKGQTVSYGGTWCAPKDGIVAILPVGYADGYSRLLSNKAKVLIRGKHQNVIGKVCMDYLCVDVSDFPDLDTTEEVVLLGEQDGSEISAHQMAEWADTIPYEIMCSISDRVPRTYIR